MKYNESKPENIQILENVEYRKCSFAILNQESSSLEENSLNVYLGPGNITSHTGRLGVPLTKLYVSFLLLHTLILDTSQTQISEQKSKEVNSIFSPQLWLLVPEKGKPSLQIENLCGYKEGQHSEEHISNYPEKSFPEQVNFNRG